MSLSGLIVAALRPLEEHTGALGRVVRSGRLALARAWARLRAWRRIRFTSAGLIFSAGTMAVGLAAMNTGNNLLYLLMGGMCGLIVVSSLMSEQAIGLLELRRHLSRGVTVGHDARILYDVTNHKQRLPTIALELREEGLAEAAFFARVPPGATETAASVHTFVRRGIYPLSTLTVSTSFPFGLFFKERDVELEGELIIWPRHDRPVRAPFPGAGRARVRGQTMAGAPGTRGDYRGLRPYRPGDDPKDIHWRKSARLEAPVVREYERDASETLWICLDLGGEAGSDPAEALVEVAASLAARAELEGKRFAVVAGARVVMPGSGPGQLEAALDALARVDFHEDEPPPAPPIHASRCVLVSLTGRSAALYGDAYVGAPGTTPDEEEAA